MAYYDQARYNVRCEWGLRGLEELASADIVVIVDVLSFTTTVEIAVSRGATVFPYLWRDDTTVGYAAKCNAEIAGSRNDAKSAYSLAPSSVVAAPPGLRLVVPSPNGSTLAFQARSSGARVVAGSLRNASAVARWIQSRLGTVLVVPAGERWPDGSLRAGLEDLIGAGAILSKLTGSLSPEAEAAVSVFQGTLDDLQATMQACSSGRELSERGFQRDVELATELDVSTTVPILDESAFVSTPG